MTTRRGEARRAQVLVVEDDPGDQEITRRALVQHGLRSDLHMVSQAEDALRLLGLRPGSEQRMAPDLILLDLNLPGDSGQQVLREVRANAALRWTPVVVVSTSARESDVIECHELGASSYLVKPLEARRYMEALQQIHDYWCQLVARPPREAL